MANQEIKTKKILGSPTQQFLAVSEIRDDMLIMKNGGIRSVLAVSSTNFDLKNEEEQNALIYGYQRFVNSLEYHIQILMQSRKMEISDYTTKLKEKMQSQTNELLKVQTAEYVDFVDRLVESANVMNKNFYVIVPYNIPIDPNPVGLFAKIFGSGQSKQIADRETKITEGRRVLDERTTTVESNLSSIGLRVVRLNTNQLIELVYNSYNFAAGPTIDAAQLSKITINANQQ
ncbi:MAG: hypothetical protein R3B41_00535 [Candidatus Doudnabacteria bacterium]